MRRRTTEILLQPDKNDKNSRLWGRASDRQQHDMVRISSVRNILHTNTLDKDTLEVLNVLTGYFTRKGGGEGAVGAIFVFYNLSFRCHLLFSQHSRPLLLSEVHPSKTKVIFITFT